MERKVTLRKKGFKHYKNGSKGKNSGQAKKKKKKSRVMGLVMDKVALGHVFPRVLRFSPVSSIPPVLHYTGGGGGGGGEINVIIKWLDKKPQCCGASVASAAGPFTKKLGLTSKILIHY
jgi:hypothetical protein